MDAPDGGVGGAPQVVVGPVGEEEALDDDRLLVAEEEEAFDDKIVPVVEEEAPDDEIVPVVEDRMIIDNGTHTEDSEEIFQKHARIMTDFRRSHGK